MPATSTSGIHRKKETHDFDVSSGDGQKRLFALSQGLPQETYTQPAILPTKEDYGADPLGDGTFKMLPSGDIVDYEERCRRLNKDRVYLIDEQGGIW